MKLKLSDVSSKYGATMGRRSRYPLDTNSSIKLRLERLKWVDGCYDSGGSYWGNNGEDFIYCAWTEEEFPCRQDNYTEEPVTNQVLIFVRAEDRDGAKKLIKEELPNARFYR